VHVNLLNQLSKRVFFAVRYFLGAASPEDEIADSSTGRAITLSTLTTICGFGSLMIARHQGIRSLGLLLTLAKGSCLVASVAVLPSLLRVLPAGARRRIWRTRQARGGMEPEATGARSPLSNRMGFSKGPSMLQMFLRTCLSTIQESG
jgi:hypothetical protein